MTTLELPSARDEAWRWADLDGIRAAATAEPQVTGIDPKTLFLDLDGPRLLFADGWFEPAHSLPGPVRVTRMEADTAHPLGRLAAGEGWALDLEPEQVVTHIQIVHLASGGRSHLPARLTLGEDAVASVVETYAGRGWANRFTRIALARGARLMRSVRLLQDEGFVSIRDEAEVGEAASLVSIFLGAGAMGSRIDGALTLTGKGAFAEMGGALLTRAAQQQEAAVAVRHAAPEGTSRQTWRAVAADQSVASLAARVEVARHAQKTDGEQSLRGLLLKRTATVNLKPELEIFADDVKCAHGATVGELDRAALYYLQSRGIDEGRAKALLTRAFVADALGRIGEEDVRAAFEADAERWLEAGAVPLPPAGGDRGGAGIRDTLSEQPLPRPLPQAEGEPMPLDLIADFPAIPAGWAYLDTAATAQKPQAVIDAIARGYDTTYATVHRGVYQRSADMTLAYEAARRRIARFIGAQADEIVFVRGATEAINLVAQCWAATQLKAGDRILLSTLEHHSNIVPWQMIAERVGAKIDVVPLTTDHRVDLDAMARMLTDRHRLVSLAHVSNVLGSVLDARRAAELAHGVGAKLLLDGCQAVPRMPVDVAALGCDFYVFSGHKLYGPTGIGVLWGRAELLDAMPPYQGGGAMIDRVTFAKTSYAPPPARFEAGTPHIVGALGLHAAIDYVDGIGVEAIHAHEAALVREAREALSGINSVRLFGPEDSAGIVSFAIEGVHPHDIGTILDEGQVAIRAGHHCAQPLMETLGVPATARASFGVYNGPADIAALVKGIERVRKIFG